jgi:hypothetical protein
MLGFGLMRRQGGSFDYDFGKPVWRVRDHSAEDVTVVGSLMTLPNSLGAGFPPAYTQATEVNHPDIGFVNGLKVLRSPGTNPDVQWLTSASSNEAVGTDVFVLFQRIGLSFGGFLGNSTGNVRLTFQNDVVRRVNVYGTATGTGAVPPGEWHIAHFSMLEAAGTSKFRVYDLAGNIVSNADSTAAQGSLTLDMIMSTVYSLPPEAGDVSLRRFQVYSHDYGIPSDGQATEIMAAIAAEWTATSTPFDFTFGQTDWLVRDHDAIGAYDDGTLYLPNSLGALYPPAYLQADAAQKPTIETHLASGLKWLKSDKASDTATGTAHLTTASNYSVRDTDIFLVMKRLPTPGKSRFWAGEDGVSYRAAGFNADGKTLSYNVVAGISTGTVNTPEDEWMVLHISINSSGPAASYRAYNAAGTLIDAQASTSAPSASADVLLASAGTSTSPLFSGHCGIAKMLVFDHAAAVPTASQALDIITALGAEYAAPLNT